MKTAAAEFLAYLIIQNNPSRLLSTARSDHMHFHTPMLSLESVQNQFYEINLLTGTHKFIYVY